MPMSPVKQGIGLLCLVAGLVQFCSSQPINCTTSVTSNGTLYTVPEFNASRCIYSWTNGTGLVVADKFGKMDGLVVTSNITAILLSECLEEVKYTRSCPSERRKVETVCYITCDGRGDQIKNESLSSTSLSRTHIIVIIVVVILVVTVIAILCFIFSNKVQRWRERRYAAVKKENQLETEKTEVTSI